MLLTCHFCVAMWQATDEFETDQSRPRCVSTFLYLLSVGDLHVKSEGRYLTKFATNIDPCFCCVKFLLYGELPVMNAIQPHSKAKCLTLWNANVFVDGAQLQFLEWVENFEYHYLIFPASSWRNTRHEWKGTNFMSWQEKLFQIYCSLILHFSTWIV